MVKKTSKVLIKKKKKKSNSMKIDNFRRKYLNLIFFQEDIRLRS